MRCPFPLHTPHSPLSYSLRCLVATHLSLGRKRVINNLLARLHLTAVSHSKQTSSITGDATETGRLACNRLLQLAAPCGRWKSMQSSCAECVNFTQLGTTNYTQRNAAMDEVGWGWDWGWAGPRGGSVGLPVSGKEPQIEVMRRRPQSVVRHPTPLSLCWSLNGALSRGLALAVARVRLPN